MHHVRRNLHSAPHRRLANHHGSSGAALLHSYSGPIGPYLTHDRIVDYCGSAMGPVGYMRAKSKVNEVRHAGFVTPLCGMEISDERKIYLMNPDLGYERLKQLGVVERFKDEAPYRVCGRCLQAVKAGWRK